MSYPINYPRPQGANVQIFTNFMDGNSLNTGFTWTKPQGASFVWFTLIGGGGSGTPTSGGCSSAVTNFMCPAFLIPDSLRINVGSGGVSSGPGTNTTVVYQQKNGAGYTLLTATRGQAGGGAGGAAMTANAFTAMGFFQSVAGQTGGAGNPNASATTFLSAGAGGGVLVTANYGYSTPNLGAGYFQLQPIIVGVGSSNGRAGVGCGGGAAANDPGGDGLVVIITW